MNSNFTIVNKIVLLCAKRNSGKSELLKKLVENEKNLFSTIFVICPTESVNHFYIKSGLVKTENVFENWNEKWAAALIKKMTEINDNKPKSELKQILLILDDAIADVDFRTSPSLKRLFVRSRHIGIGIILTSQYLNSISPLQRNNSDFILCSQMNAKSVDILSEEFLNSTVSKKDFLEIYAKGTKDYGFILINNNSTKGNTLDELFGIMRCKL